jgi:hypothetical protein
MDRADFVHLVRLSEHASADDSARYRRGVAAFAALGYLWVLGCLGLAAGLIVWVLSSIREERFSFTRGWVLLFAGGLLWATLRALWVRFDEPDGVELQRDDAPALFDALDRIRARIKGPRVHRVYLDDDFNASIRQVPRFGLFGGAINSLSIGLPLLMMLDRRRLLSVLAHEYGHLRGNHGKIERLDLPHAAVVAQARRQPAAQRRRDGAVFGRLLALVLSALRRQDFRAGPAGRVRGRPHLGPAAGHAGGGRRADRDRHQGQLVRQRVLALALGPRRARADAAGPVRGPAQARAQAAGRRLRPPGAARGDAPRQRPGGHPPGAARPARGARAEGGLPEWSARSRRSNCWPTGRSGSSSSTPAGAARMPPTGSSTTRTARASASASGCWPRAASATRRTMHPKALLDACADLVAQVLRFDHPPPTPWCRATSASNRSLGPRERATLAETAYAVLRNKLLFEHLAPPAAGRASAGWRSSASPAPARLPAGALNDQEKNWLEAVRRRPSVRPAGAASPQPARMAGAAAEGAAGRRVLAAGGKPERAAPLDLRVNTLTDKREDVQKELKLAGIAAKPTPYSPWGLRLEGKPALTKLDAFARGAVEVQDEGSQLLALLLMPSAARWWSTSAPARAARRWRWARRCATPAGCMPSTLGAPAGQPEAAAGAQQAVERASGGDRPRARRPHQAPGRQDRPRDRRRALLRPGHAAPQSGPEVAPVAAGVAE